MIAPMLPNYSMHKTLPLRGIAGDFERWTS